GLATIGVTLGMDAAFAGNDGRGGDAIVCFAKGLSGNVVLQGTGYALTKEGRANIHTAETREGYRIRHLSKRSGFLASLEGKTEAEAFELMLKRFQGVPGFYQLLKEMHERLDAIEDGFNARGGLEDIKDTGLKYQLEDANCVFAQAVVREKSTFSRDGDVFDKFVPVQRALIRFHEVTYAVGDESFGHDNSGPTERVLLHAFGQDLPAERLASKIKENGFGEWLTVGIFKKEIEKQIQVPAMNMRTFLAKVLSRARTNPVFPKSASSGGGFLFGNSLPILNYESLFTEEENEAIFDIANIYPSIRREFPIVVQKWALRFNCEAGPAREMLNSSSADDRSPFGNLSEADPTQPPTYGFPDLSVSDGKVYGAASSLERVCPSKKLTLSKAAWVSKGTTGVFSPEAIAALAARVAAIDQLITLFPKYQPTDVDVLKYELTLKSQDAAQAAAAATPKTSDGGTAAAIESAAKSLQEAARTSQELSLRLAKVIAELERSRSQQ
ncbi:MAG: hypothetical protein K2X47_06440, partial [Bdellovibrionales bacterium]|nr:hypothetical protein [Bdellovibrionales bacterium]